MASENWPIFQRTDLKLFSSRGLFFLRGLLCDLTGLPCANTHHPPVLDILCSLQSNRNRQVSGITVDVG